MTPVQQTILATSTTAADGINPDGTSGNCLQAAVASLLDLPLDEVPHFVDDPDPDHDWWSALRRWARGRGNDVHYVPADHPVLMQWLRGHLEADGRQGHAIAAGRSPRGDFGHVVVVDCWLQPVWDPHPSGGNLISVHGYYVWGAPYDPPPSDVPDVAELERAGGRR